MKKILIVFVMVLLILQTSGCTNKVLDAFNEEKEQLTNEISKLKSIISKKDKEIAHLENANSDYRDKINELSKSLEMIKFSSYARLNDYNDAFSNLEKIYKINSNYKIRDDWYVINDDYFEIELLGYEDALKVDFYTIRMESGDGPVIVFSDTDPSDGWIYNNDNISQIINKHTQLSGGFSYEPYFLLYTEVSLKDDKIIKTPKLPIYN